MASWSSARGAAGPTSIFSASGARRAQQPRVHLVVVDDDVRRFEVALAAHADETRIAGAGADDEDAGALLHPPPLSVPYFVQDGDGARLGQLVRQPRAQLGRTGRIPRGAAA